MLIEHDGKSPRIDDSAWVAPSATVSGDVEVGPDSRIMFGAVVSADGGPVRIGAECVVMENAVLRGTARHPLTLGDRTLVGPHAHLSGCTLGDEVFIATGASVFNGAHIGTGSEVRINGIVHVKTVLVDDSVVPIGWVAVGDPVSMFPPGEADAIWEVLEPLNFPREVFGVERSPDLMRKVMKAYARGLGRHTQDKLIE